MTSAKFMTVMLVLTAALVLDQVGAIAQSSMNISRFGTIRDSLSGPIIFESSFEDDSLGVFGVENQTLTPKGWFPDIDLQFGNYGEVVDTEAQDGNQSVKLYTPASTRAALYSCLSKWLLQNYPEFYVRWYQKFESLPMVNWKNFRIAFLEGGASPYATPTAWIEIIHLNDVLNIGMRRLWTTEGVHEVLVPYPFVINTWYKFEIYYKYGITDGEYRLLINDEEVITITGQDTTPRDKVTGEKYTGDDILYNLPNGWDGGIENKDDTSSHTVYVDNFLFANYFYEHEPPSGYLDITANIDSTEVSANVIVSNSTQSIAITTPAVLTTDAGRYNLTATYHDQRQSISVTVFANQITSVAFRFIVPPQTVTLMGRVADEKGNGIADVTIYCIGNSTKLTTTKQTGAYSLTVPRGNYTLIYLKQDFQAETKKVEFPTAGQEYTVDVTLYTLKDQPSIDLTQLDPLPFILLAMVVGTLVFIFIEKKA